MYFITVMECAPAAIEGEDFANLEISQQKNQIKGLYSPELREGKVQANHTSGGILPVRSSSIDR